MAFRLAHLDRSLFRRDSNLFAMVNAYFDDSGTSPTDQATVVAGYLASVVQWKRFETQWGRLLKKYGVQRMHRADLESLKGEFSEKNGWTAERKQKLLREAHQIIRRTTYTAVGSAVIKSDFEDVIPEKVKKWVGGPYGWVALNCIVDARHWLEAVKEKNPIDWFFEAGTTGAGQLSKMLRDIYVRPKLRNNFCVGSWSFVGKDVLPIQAADFLAYEVYKQVKNQVIDGGQRKVRWSAMDLFKPHEYDRLRYQDKNNLRDLIQRPVTKRLFSLIERVS